MCRLSAFQRKLLGTNGGDDERRKRLISSVGFPVVVRSAGGPLGDLLQWRRRRRELWKNSRFPATPRGYIASISLASESA